MLEDFLSAVLPFIPITVIIIIILVILLATIKVASGNEVLVVTGMGATKKVTKRIKVRRPKKPQNDTFAGDGFEEVEEEQITYVPKIKIAGAAIVFPFIQQCHRFDICVKKAGKDNDTMKTKTGVEIVIDWSISYAPNADSIGTLQPCIRQFLDKDDEETEDIVMSSVAGGMRAVISTMTPKEVMVGKETLDEAVQKNIAEQMAELGYKVQIYIQEVRDAHNSTYYKDLAAEDRERTRQDAEKITAEAEQAIREKRASTEQAAKKAELASEVEIADRARDAAVKKATFKTETDKANADAAVAGEMQRTERQRELTEKQGAVEVMKQEQAELAARAEQTVAVTKAETSKKESVIKAEAEAEKNRINAKAAADVAETNARGKAKAAEEEARGESQAAQIKAQGESEAIKRKAEADAKKIGAIGEAEARAIEAKGRAEASAIEAKGRAEAEAARALSDAQAANDRVNFEIKRLEINRDTTVQVMTSIASVMAKIGENATFYDFGGGREGGSDLLTRVMGNTPKLFAKANLENQALNGQPLTDTIKDLASAVFGSLGALDEKKTVVMSAPPESKGDSSALESPSSLDSLTDHSSSTES